MFYFFLNFNLNEILLYSPDLPYNYYLGQVFLKLMTVLLAQPPPCWDYRCVPPPLTPPRF